VARGRLPAPPPGTPTATWDHRVGFYETDAMGIVHHANYVNFLERARVVFMEEHDRPYREYIEQGLHFATTRVEVDYLRPARFDDVVRVCTWLEALRGASLRMAYRLTRDEEPIAAAATEHALVDTDGRPRRIPRPHHARLRTAAAPREGGRPKRGTFLRSGRTCQT